MGDITNNKGGNKEVNIKDINYLAYHTTDGIMKVIITVMVTYEIGKLMIEAQQVSEGVLWTIGILGTIWAISSMIERCGGEK